MDLVLGTKNVFELEVVTNSSDCCFKFLNRSMPIFPEKNVILKPNEQKLIKVRAPFMEYTRDRLERSHSDFNGDKIDLSRVVIIKLQDKI